MGTMTFGEQNTLEEGVEQLNVAFDEYGINFIDTAGTYVSNIGSSVSTQYYYLVVQPAIFPFQKCIQFQPRPKRKVALTKRLPSS